MFKIQKKRRKKRRDLSLLLKRIKYINIGGMNMKGGSYKVFKERKCYLWILYLAPEFSSVKEQINIFCKIIQIYCSHDTFFKKTNAIAYISLSKDGWNIMAEELVENTKSIWQWVSY